MAIRRSDVAYLVSESYTLNDYGVHEPTETKRKVYVGVDSVTGQEWFEGGRNGLNPQYRFTMFQYDYKGEKIIEFNNVKYAIYRTYIKNNDLIELYAELKKGSERNESQTENN